MTEPSTAAFAAVLNAFGLHGLGAPLPVDGGALNWNYSLSTTGGDVFVRRHRNDVTAARVREEHAAIQFAGERSVPVALPLRTVAGDSVTEIGGDPWAVFPRVAGTSLAATIEQFVADARGL